MFEKTEAERDRRAPTLVEKLDRLLDHADRQRRVNTAHAGALDSNADRLDRIEHFMRQIFPDYDTSAIPSSARASSLQPDLVTEIEKRIDANMSLPEGVGEPGPGAALPDPDLEVAGAEVARAAGLIDTDDPDAYGDAWKRALAGGIQSTTPTFQGEANVYLDPETQLQFYRLRRLDPLTPAEPSGDTDAAPESPRGEDTPAPLEAPDGVSEPQEELPVEPEPAVPAPRARKK